MTTLVFEDFIILIAPNVSEQMGGEAIKALQIFQEFKKIRPTTIQITHARNRSEIKDRLALPDVLFIDDSFLSLLVWRTVILRFAMDFLFFKKAIRLAEEISRTHGTNARTIVHQTEPNSPVMPRLLAKGCINIFGPINGNIYYPLPFRKFEKTLPRLRRLLHMPFQKLNKLFACKLSKADSILTAGGNRTRNSLIVAGCDPKILVESLDCGIKNSLLDRRRVIHQGENFKFIHFGRLVFHKCTFLIIQSLPKTRNNVCLDIVGTGPELENCKAIVKKLGLEKRVRFLGWYIDHSDLFESFHDYRGVVLPSIEDANGIVIQEAMALGLPPICLNWGGPQLLIDDGIDGFLVEPKSIEYITDQLAVCLDKLGQDGSLAESFSVAGREKAENWRWSSLARKWIASYPG